MIGINRRSSKSTKNTDGILTMTDVRECFIRGNHGWGMEVIGVKDLNPGCWIFIQNGGECTGVRLFK